MQSRSPGALGLAAAADRCQSVWNDVTTAAPGGTLSIATSSPDFWDTIAIVLAPDGTPVVGSDDANDDLAAFDWVAPATGTYTLQDTSFESINTGTLVVTRG